MAKVKNIMTGKDKLIDLLIDDKNRLFMEKRKLLKEIQILKNQVSFQKSKNRVLSSRNKELVNELFEFSESDKRSKAK